MFTPQEMLWAIVYPLVAAVLIVLIAHLPRRGRRDAQPWGPAAAIACAFTIAFIGVSGRWTPPARDVYAWLIVAAGVAVVVSIIASVGERTRWTVVGLSIALLVATVALIAWRRKASLQPAQFWTSVAVTTGGLVVWWASMEPLAALRRGATIPLFLSAAAGASALVLTDGGTARFGKIAGGAAVALLVVALMAMWLRDLSLARGGVLATAIAVLGLLVCGYYYADVARIDVAIIAAAPLMAWFGELPLIRSRKPWLRFIITAVLVLGVLAVAVVPAAQGLRKTMQEQSEYML